MPSTVDLLLNNAYHGLSDGRGVPIAYTKTPGTATNQRLVGDVVKSFTITKGMNLNRKMTGQLLEFSMKTTTAL